MKYCLIVTVTCLSLMTMILSILCAYWPFVYLLYRNIYLSRKSYSDPLSIFNWVVFLLLSCKDFLSFLDTSLLTYIYELQIFSPVLMGCLFNFLNGVLWSTKVFNFNEVQFGYFSFVAVLFVSYFKSFA